MRRSTHRRPTDGFTIIELLVVMAILSVLIGLAAVGVPRLIRSGDKAQTEAFVSQLAAVIEAYARRPSNGDYPPTVLDAEGFPGVGVLTNDENTGIESLMICLNRIGAASSFEVEDIPWGEDALQNYDGDRTAKALTDFGRDTRDLFELCDLWGTPFAYFHSRDYDRVESKALGRISGGEGGTVKALPWKNPKTRTWYKRKSFQLFSAGPDGKFNTDDDIGNFQRR